MIKTKDDTQKIYVSSSGTAVIKCPRCELGKSVQADRFRGSKHIPKVKCKCGHLFRINLEFRKSYRKKTNLPGDYQLLSEHIQRGKMTVANISKGGVGLNIIGAHRLKPGQELRVIFTLDDHGNSEINRRVVVRLINGSYVGCEFIGDVSHDKALGFYLMP